MDVTKDIRRAYKALISAQSYIVYDRFLPDNIGAGTYVILSDQDDQRQNNKCDNGHIATLIVNIIHRTEDNSSGVECDTIAEVIVPLIENDGLQLSAGLTLIKGSSRKISDTTDSGIDNTFKFYRRVIRFEHIIKEN